MTEPTPPTQQITPAPEPAKPRIIWHRETWPLPDISILVGGDYIRFDLKASVYLFIWIALLGLAYVVGKYDALNQVALCQHFHNMTLTGFLSY